jgi:hypothetical protein
VNGTDYTVHFVGLCIFRNIISSYFLQNFLEKYDCALYLCQFNVMIFFNKFPKGFDSRKMQLATSFHCAFQENETRNYSKKYILIRNYSSLLVPQLVCLYVSPKHSEDLTPTISSNP